MKKIYISLLLLFCILPLCLADTTTSIVQTLGTFKQGDCVILKQICSTCSQNTIISVSYPNSSQALGTTAMNVAGNEYTYSFCNTSSALGRYIVNGYGDPGGTPQTWAYDFYITTTGNSAPLTIPLIIGLAAFILLIFAFLLHNNYIGFITGILFIVLGLYLFVYGLGIISDFYTNTIALISLGVGLLIFLASAYSAINETNINLFGRGGGEDDDGF